jgi:nitrogen fixation protein NifU and related proteins
LSEAPEEQQNVVNELRKDGYSDIVIDHWVNPRNFGQMEEFDGYSDTCTASCGDSMWFWIKVNNNVIQKASYVSDVCIGSVTSGSILAEMIKGKTIASALRISKDDILKELGGLPAQFVHCAKLAKDTLNMAIIDYNSYKNTPWKRAYQKS